MIPFTDHTDKMIRQASKKGHSWYLPLGWNGECFDALCYEPTDHFLDVVKIIEAPPRECDLTHLIPYVAAMDVHEIEFTYICRRASFESFRLPNVNTSEIEAALELQADETPPQKLRFTYNSSKPRRFAFKTMCYW